MGIELSLNERLLLSNQLRILEMLCPQQADHYATWREAVQCGYQLDYDQSGTQFSDGLSTEDCVEVRDILMMYLSFGTSLELDDNGGITFDEIKFPGFYGNGDEAQRLSYAHYCVEKLRMFPELKGSLVGVLPLLPAYKRMLRLWREVANPHEMSVEQIRAVLAEGVDPSNR